MASNDPVMDEIRDHVENGYSRWDRFRKWLCKDLIDREIGLKMIEARRGLGIGFIGPSRGNTWLVQFNQWFGSAFKDYFDKGWEYLRSKGIDYKEDAE